MFRRERERLQKLVLVPYRPFRNLSLGVGGVALIILSGFLGFYVGRDYGIEATGASPEEVMRLRQTVRLFSAESQKLRDEASVTKHDRDIVLAATEQLRVENKNLLTTIAGLEEQVSLLKRIASPKSGAAQGIGIDKFEVNATTTPRKYGYRLLLTQGNSTANTAANVEIKLVGGGVTKKMKVGDADVYQFQYFQNIVGEWELPAGFNPERADIVVTTTGAKSQRVEKRFKWEIKRG